MIANGTSIVGTAFPGDIITVYSRPSVCDGGVYLDVDDDMGGETSICLNYKETLTLIEALKKHIVEAAL